MISIRMTPRLIVIGALAFAVTSMSLAYSLHTSMTTLSSTADQIDDERAVTATSGAVKAFGRQLGSTIRDNAYWEDAYKTLQTPEREEWVASTWGLVTEDYPLYDTMILLAPGGGKHIGYHKGEPLVEPLAFLDESVEELLRQAKRPEALEAIPVAFVESRHGPMIIGAAAVQPTQADRPLDPETLSIMMMGKEITPTVMAEMAENFSIKDLKLEETPTPGRLATPLKNARGETLYYFTWPPERPGSKSFEQVKPALTVVAAIFLLLLVGIVWSAWLFIANLRSHEASARFDAGHDALTRLVNRAGLAQHLQQVLDDPETGRLVLHFFGLDNFKNVNETWGHALGDALLSAIADRMRTCFGEAVCLARLGGDEFAVLAGRHLGAEILAALKEPFRIRGRVISIGVSIGVAARETDVVTVAEFVRRADLALHRAKRLGRNRILDFSPDHDREDAEQREIEDDLRLAIEACEIGVVFQPIIAARSRAVVGVEALARWTHPERGPIRPDIFVRVAERGGLVDDLGRLVLCKALIALRDRDDIWVSVNVSPVQLRNPGFADELEYLLRELDFDPSRLLLEVTEGVIISEPELAKRSFARLKELGIRIALDDFGCGYASVGTLREFGFDKMKLDRSLTVIEDVQGATLLNATVALASALGLPVTAEGVETAEQAAIMETVGCSDMQGYLFSRPVPLDELNRFLACEEQEDIRAA
jgi:diguanylate cyclase (GGDEF)-like protein